jgi:eukaryotic-like serine/threonine-protein kinase
MVLTSGHTLGDRYRLDSPIAAGGMGEVWHAIDTVLGREVAVKVLLANRAVDPAFQSRFLHEARTMAALHHPGIADVYDFGAAGDGAYLVMAYVHGQPLDDRIAERGHLSPAETMSIVAQAARALAAAHAAGIIHRDVKPGNLIVQQDGGVVLVDFGIARSAMSTTLTGVDEVIGTALYFAPEQASKGEIGPATDIYALGVVAYHCLAGRPPFEGDNAITIAMQHLDAEPPPLPADVPPPVRALVAIAMAKDPANRFPDATSMAEAATNPAAAAPVGGFVAGAASVDAGPTVRMRPANGSGTSVLPAPPRAPRHTPKRSFVPWAAALAGLGVLAVILAFALSSGSSGDPGAPPATPGGRVPGSAGVGQNGDGGTRPATTAPSRRPRTTSPATRGPATGQPGPGPAPTPAPTLEPTQGPTGAPEPTDDGGGVDVSPTPP